MYMVKGHYVCKVAYYYFGYAMLCDLSSGLKMKTVEKNNMIHPCLCQISRFDTIILCFRKVVIIIDDN
jgi:hypothetical protein